MRALFPGSFDPITRGHIDIIKRSSKIFDELVIAVLSNSQKKSLFTAQERLTLIQKEIANLKNVSVIKSENTLTIKLAQKLNTNVIIRGVRDCKDFEFEKQIATLNHQLDQNIETFLLPTNPDVESISSSMIKEIAMFGGNLESFVSKNVKRAIEEKINEEKD